MFFVFITSSNVLAKKRTHGMASAGILSALFTRAQFDAWLPNVCILSVSLALASSFPSDGIILYLRLDMHTDDLGWLLRVLQSRSPNWPRVDDPGGTRFRSECC